MPGPHPGDRHVHLCVPPRSTHTHTVFPKTPRGQQPWLFCGRTLFCACCSPAPSLNNSKHPALQLWQVGHPPGKQLEEETAAAQP